MNFNILIYYKIGLWETIDFVQSDKKFGYRKQN